MADAFERSSIEVQGVSATFMTSFCGALKDGLVELAQGYAVSSSSSASSESSESSMSSANVSTSSYSDSASSGSGTTSSVTDSSCQNVAVKVSTSMEPIWIGPSFDKSEYLTSPQWVDVKLMEPISQSAAEAEDFDDPCADFVLGITGQSNYFYTSIGNYTTRKVLLTVDCGTLDPNATVVHSGSLTLYGGTWTALTYIRKQGAVDATLSGDLFEWQITFSGSQGEPIVEFVVEWKGDWEP